MHDETTIKLKKQTRDVMRNIKKMNKYDSYDTLINEIMNQTDSIKKLRMGRI
jgi:hypothetical protein